jgi:hypothetical protein
VTGHSPGFHVCYRILLLLLLLDLGVREVGAADFTSDANIPELEAVLRRDSYSGPVLSEMQDYLERRCRRCRRFAKRLDRTPTACGTTS